MQFVGGSEDKVGHFVGGGAIRRVTVLDEESESTVALRSSPIAVAFTAITHI